MLVQSIVESVPLSVCMECAKFGTILRPPKQNVEIKKEKRVPQEVLPHQQENLVAGWSDLLRQKREKLRLTQKQFAKMLAERESLVQKLENGKIEPSAAMAAKLEHVLKIKILEKTEEGQQSIDTGNSRGMTIGDIIKKT